MPFEVVVLGSGTNVPAPTRAPSGLLVRGRGAVALLDSGPGTAGRLVRAGVGLDELDAIFYSHLHLDHVGELPAILNALSIPGEAPPRRRDLPLYGPPGFAAHVAALRALYGDWIEPAECAAPARDLAAGDVVALGGLRVVARRVVHKGECFAYRVEAEGLAAVYSGDSGECDELVEAARDADLFVCECSFAPGRPATYHLTAAAAGRVARRAGVRRLVLTHLYPTADRTDVVAAARAEFDGEVVRAEDGLRLPLGAGALEPP